MSTVATPWVSKRKCYSAKNPMKSRQNCLLFIVLLCIFDKKKCGFAFAKDIWSSSNDDAFCWRPLAKTNSDQRPEYNLLTRPTNERCFRKSQKNDDATPTDCSLASYELRQMLTKFRNLKTYRCNNGKVFCRKYRRSSPGWSDVTASEYFRRWGNKVKILIY